MVVIAIVGILAAIAIPQFLKFRQQSYNASALSDMHNIMVGEEAEYASNQQYTSVPPGTGPAWILGKSKFISINVGYVVNTSGSGDQFAVFTGHAKGTREFGGDKSGAIRYKAVSNPANAAQAETAFTVSGWGSLL